LRIVVRSYRTEIVIPPDRFVGLQLPAHLPEGRAVVTVVVQEPDPAEAAAPDLDADRQDIEWWDEFEDDRASDAAEGGR
jgi:hypothetical protein